MGEIVEAMIDKRCLAIGRLPKTSCRKLVNAVDMRQPRRVGQDSQDVLTVQVFVVRQNVVNGHAAGQPFQNTFDRIAQAPNTWLAMTDVGVDGDEGVHRSVKPMQAADDPFQSWRVGL